MNLKICNVRNLHLYIKNVIIDLEILEKKYTFTKNNSTKLNKTENKMIMT